MPSPVSGRKAPEAKDSNVQGHRDAVPTAQGETKRIGTPACGAFADERSVREGDSSDSP